MARKRPMEDPSPASSAEEEEEIEDSDSSKDEDQTDNKILKNKTRITDNNSYESDSDFESDPEECPPTPQAQNFIIKPVVKMPKSATKSMEGRSNTKLKRESKVPSSSKAADVKSPFQRVWSADDELRILNAMIEFKSEKGTDPNADMGGFYDFFKKSLRDGITKTQLIVKIRKLKEKYQKKVIEGKSGEDLIFSKPHEQKCFELWKKIWGTGSNGLSISKKKSKTSGYEFQELNEENGRQFFGLGSAGKDKKDDCQKTQLNGCDEKEAPIENNDFLKDYPFLNEYLEVGKSWNLPDFCKHLLREKMLKAIGTAKVNDLEVDLMKLQKEELMLHVKKIQLNLATSKIALGIIKG